MWASSFIPESFGDIMKDLASEVYASGTGRLSITMITAVYLSSKAFISFQLGLDDMYHVKENRNFILRRIYSVLYSIVLHWRSFFTGYHGVWKYAQEDVFFECSSYNWKYNRQCGRLSSGNLPAGAYFIFWVIYVFLPNKKRRAKYQLPGAVFAAAAWMIFRESFLCTWINTIIILHFMAQ